MSAEQHCKQNFGLKPKQLMSPLHGIFLRLCDVLINKKNAINKTLCRAILSLSCIDVRVDKCFDILNEYRPILISENESELVGNSEETINTFQDALCLAVKIENFG